VKFECVICCEWYRTPDQTYQVDDYMVDGIVVLKPVLDCTEAKDLSDDLELYFSTMLKNMVQGMKEVPEAQLQFPKLWAKMTEGVPYWFHIMTRDSLDSKPKEFHGNGFTDAELLGAPVEEEQKPTLDLMYNSDGERIPDHPDKFMLSIGAV
jgi:hypothetical protein